MTYQGEGSEARGFVGKKLQAVGLGLLVIVCLHVWNAVQLLHSLKLVQLTSFEHNDEVVVKFSKTYVKV